MSILEILILWAAMNVVLVLGSAIQGIGNAVRDDLLAEEETFNGFLPPKAGS